MTTGPENPYGGPQQPPYQPPQQPPNQPPNQPPPPYGYGYQQPFQPPVPNHPSTMTALVLGIIGLAGILTCGGVTLVLSPFAWAIGGKAVKEIDAAPPGTYAGREQANAGRIMGIIGTILLILGIIVVVALIGLLVAFGDSSSTTYGDY